MKIHIEEVSFSWGLGQNRIGPFQFTLEQGMTTIFGKNGSGKTTLIKAICQMKQVRDGQIRYEVQGKTLSPIEAKMQLGYVPQQPSFYEEMTVAHYLQYIADLKYISASHKKEELKRVSWLFGLGELMDIRLKRLSAGQQRLAMISQAFLGSPRFIIMDEPFVGVDLAHRRGILNELQSYASQAVVALTSHDVEDQDLLGCSRVLCM